MNSNIMQTTGIGAFGTKIAVISRHIDNVIIWNRMTHLKVHLKAECIIMHWLVPRLQPVVSFTVSVSSCLPGCLPPWHYLGVLL